MITGFNYDNLIKIGFLNPGEEANKKQYQKSFDILITNDSAPLHIAGSVDTPVIAIFGPTDHRKYGPISPGSIVLRKHLACSPCEKAVCEFDLECMKQVSSDDVLNAAERILLL